MSTKIVGSRFENSPREDVFAKFAKLADNTVPLNIEACIERAKIAREHGFLVDPFTGRGFWVLGKDKNASIAGVH